MGVRVDQRTVPLKPCVKAGSSTGAGSQLTAADLAGLNQVVRQANPLPELRRDHQWIRAAAEAPPDGDSRVVLDAPVPAMFDSLRSTLWLWDRGFV